MIEKKNSASREAAGSAGGLSESTSLIINHRYFPLFFSSLFFVVMIFIAYSFHKIGDYGVETDFYQSFVPLARDFLHGILTFDSYKGPGYQVVLGITGALFPDFFSAGIFIGVVSASVFIFLTFKVVGEIFSVRAAFLTVLFVVFNPIFIQYTYSAGTDMMFAALLMLSFYFMFRNRELKYADIILAGMTGAFAYLTRYNGVIVLGYVPVLLLINFRNLSWRERIKAASVFTAAFFITIAPWGIYCLSEKGSFFFNENYRNMAYEIFGRGRISWEKFWYGGGNEFKSFGDVIFKDPVLMIKTMVGNIYSNFSGDMGRLLGWYLGVFVIAGILFYILSDDFLKRGEPDENRRRKAFYSMNVFFFLILTTVFYSERFSLFLLPFYTILFLWEFFGRTKKSLVNFSGRKSLSAGRYINGILGIVIFVLLALSAYDTFAYNAEIINSGPREILKIRDWYNTNIPAIERGKRIAARKPQVAYYLDMKLDVIPVVDNLEELLNFLKKKGDDYLYFSWEEAGTRPELKYLLDAGPEVPGLERLYSITEPPAVLYKVIK